MQHDDGAGLHCAAFPLAEIYSNWAEDAATLKMLRLLFVKKLCISTLYIYMYMYFVYICIFL